MFAKGVVAFSVLGLTVNGGVYGTWNWNFLPFVEAKDFASRKMSDWFPSIRIGVLVVPTNFVIWFSIAELSCNDLIDYGGCRVRY